MKAGMKRRRYLGGLIVVLALTAGACSDNPMAPTIDAAPRILLDQKAVLSDSHQEVITLTARVLDGSGQEVDVPLEWETDSPDVLEVLGDGSFRTLANGTASVTVRVPRTHPSVSPNGYFADMADAEALVQVEQTARRIAFFDEEDPDEPGTGSSAVTAIDIWAIDELVALAALPADNEGQVVDGLDLGGLTWTSDDDDVFTVDADGTITPVGDGETTIRVSGEGLSGEIVVRVRASQQIRTCARLSVGGSTPTEESCSSLRLTFTRGG